MVSSGIDWSLKICIMKSILFLFYLMLVINFAFGQDLKKFNTVKMQRGYFYAKSTEIDTISVGGFGTSSNVAQDIVDIPISQKNADKLFLKIDTAANYLFNGKFAGQSVFLVNDSDTTVRFDASDSRLPIIAEAIVGDSIWMPIEYLPSSWCGNSYHYLYLSSGKYWRFTVPVYGGKIKTKLRYKIMLDKTSVLTSNEVTVYINEPQLYEKEMNNDNSLMNPYID